MEQPIVDVLEINTGNQIEMVWTPLEEEVGERILTLETLGKRNRGKTKEDVHGCSHRPHEVDWTESGEDREKGLMEEVTILK